MKNFLLFMLLYCSCTPAPEHKANQTDCEKFKTGSFLHESQGDPVIYRLERTDSVQKEIIGKKGDHVNLRINWTSPCTYELTFLDQHITGTDSVPASVQQTMKVVVEILEVRNDTCFVIAESAGRRLPGIVYRDKQ